MRKRLVVGAHALLAGLVVVGGLGLAVDRLSTSSTPLDRAAMLALGLVVLALPAVLLLAWPIGRGIAWSRRERAFLLATKLAAVPAWLVSVGPTLFVLLLLRPWPLSMLDGPDNRYAREGFERHVGVAPPEGVHGIFYRPEPGWGDSRARLRFEGADAAFVEGLARRLEMEESGPQPGPDDAALGWWRAEDADLRAFARGRPEGTHTRLWFDKARGVVYLEQVNR